MKRLLVLFGALAALTVPVGAHAQTTVEKITFDATVVLCNGNLVHISGPLLVTSTSTSTPSGGLLFAIHFQPQGVAGVDLSTGTRYRATGLTRDLAVNSPPGGFTETFVNRFHIQATRGAESFIVTETFHVTISPDGTIRVEFDNFSATC